MSTLSLLNRSLLLLAFLVFSLSNDLAAQVSAEQMAEQYRNNHDFYVGEATGRSIAIAEKEAIGMLSNSISVKIVEDMSVRNVRINGVSSDSIRRTLSTYSDATIKNYKKLSWGREPNVTVFLYLERSEFVKQMEQRRDLIVRYTEDAREAEKKLQFSDALKYYYWSLVLLVQHPEKESIEIIDANKRRSLLSWLPYRINELLQDLTVERLPDQEHEEGVVGFQFRMSGNVVSSCDYRYFDGSNWSNVISTKNGVGEAELGANRPSSLKFRIEYRFEHESTVNPIVKEALASKGLPTFSKSEGLRLMIKSATEDNLRPAGVASNFVAANSLTQSVKHSVAMDNVVSFQVDNIEPYQSVLLRIDKAIREKNYESVSSLFTPQGWDIFQSLVRKGNGVVMGVPSYRFVQYGEGVSARGLNMRFSFSNNKRQFVEELVFTFDRDKRVHSIAFGLPQATCQEIMSKGRWDEYCRLTIIDFLENYQTAYALKRLDYLKSIFSENALIITGNEVKAIQVEGGMSKKQIEYTQHSKASYMANLERVFASNEFVNIKFTNADVAKAGGGSSDNNVFGIQLKQDYFSSNYGDQGYLFLMVNLNKRDMPTIYVRIWQKDKDKEFGFVDLGSLEEYLEEFNKK